MSGQFIHQEVRRRRSIDTFSTCDGPSPPYALSDVGRPRNDPEIGTRIRRAPQNTAYGYRVDDMLISWLATRFCAEPYSTNIEISTPTGVDLPRADRIVVESLKTSIRRGHGLLDKVYPYFEYGDHSSTEYFYYKLNTLWKLCVMVGARICEPHDFVSEEVAASLLKDVDCVRQHMSAIERTVLKHVAEDTGTSRTQFAELMDQLWEIHSKELDDSIEDMNAWNFELSSRTLGGENRILGQ